MNQAKPSLVRFSLRTLLVLMMLLCIALATTVSASPRVFRAMNWIVVFAPLIAVFMAVWSTGRWHKDFWFGFAAVSLWAYIDTNCGPDRFGKYTRSLAAVLRSPINSRWPGIGWSR